MVSSSGDDRDTSRKKRQTKRDCAEVVAEHPQDESGVSCEKTRKVRKYSPTTDNDKSTSNNNAASSAAESATAKAAVSISSTTNVTTKTLSSSPQESSTAKKVKTTTSATQTTTTSELSSSNKENPPVVENQDLESALSYVASIGEGRTESLSSDATLSFRVGHAGDASTLANWYKKSMASRNNNPDNHHPDGEKSQEIINSESPSKPDKSASADDSPLELWLVDGLGDEGIPPSLFALIADVSSTTREESNEEDVTRTTTSQKMAAVALLATSWENSSRVLRLEWFQVDDSMQHAKLIERRMWLRLSLLSLVTSSELRVIDQYANGLVVVTAQPQQQR